MTISTLHNYVGGAHHSIPSWLTSISDPTPASLEVWQAEGKRGVWVQIPLSQAELVPVVAKVCCVTLSLAWLHSSCISCSLTKLGFEFHHTQPGYIMMTKWLPSEEPSTLPTYATHYIGMATLCCQGHSNQSRWSGFNCTTFLEVVRSLLRVMPSQGL